MIRALLQRTLSLFHRLLYGTPNLLNQLTQQHQQLLTNSSSNTPMNVSFTRDDNGFVSINPTDTNQVPPTSIDGPGSDRTIHSVFALIDASGREGFECRLNTIKQQIEKSIAENPTNCCIHIYGFSRGCHIAASAIDYIRREHPHIKTIRACFIDPVHGMFNRIGSRIDLESLTPPDPTSAANEGTTLDYYAIISIGTEYPIVHSIEEVTLPKSGRILSKVPKENTFYSEHSHTHTPYHEVSHTIVQSIARRDTNPLVFTCYGTTEKFDDIINSPRSHCLDVGLLYRCKLNELARTSDELLKIAQDQSKQTLQNINEPRQAGLTARP